MMTNSIDRLEALVTRLEEHWLKGEQRSKSLSAALTKSGRELDEAGRNLQRLEGERRETGRVLEKAIAELADLDIETTGDMQ